jgi:hypothetical protein
MFYSMHPQTMVLTGILVALGAALVLFAQLHNWLAKRYATKTPPAKVVQPSPAQSPVEVEVKAPESTDNSDPLVVVSRPYGDSGEFTLLLRHRPKANVITVQLVLWSLTVGRKSRKSPSGKWRTEDSYYDLGVIRGNAVSSEVVDAALTLVHSKIGELVANRKARDAIKTDGQITTDLTSTASDQSSTAALQGTGPEAVPQGEPVRDAAAVNEVVAPAKTTGVVQVRRYPSVFRGVVLEVGMMEKPTGKDGNVTCFGVRLRCDDGQETTAWGSDLLGAMREAGASVGDSVELIKIGRRFIEQGKAPQALYKAAKVSQLAKAA